MGFALSEASGLDVGVLWQPGSILVVLDFFSSTRLIQIVPGCDANLQYPTDLWPPEYETTWVCGAGVSVAVTAFGGSTDATRATRKRMVSGKIRLEDACCLFGNSYCKPTLGFYC
uniref:(northern house mosquito) hypothetical protein n=1 Tax=Culex pipiens TaxID=7175 RepID=A0A8D8ATE2_CULPI